MFRSCARWSLAAVLPVALLLAAASTQATPLVGPAYPAPGGNGFSTTGGPSQNDPGGLDGHYTGFDTNAFSALYWGPQWGAGPGPQAGLDGVLHSLSFLSISGTTATWQGTTSYTSPGGPGPASCASCPIRFQIDVSGLGANPWVTEGSVAGLSGLAPGIGAVIDNSAGLDFDANFLFTADLGSGFVAINTVPQPSGSPGLTVSSFSGAFYSVPEPSLATLAFVALAGIALRRTRRA